MAAGPARAVDRASRYRRHRRRAPLFHLRLISIVAVAAAAAVASTGCGQNDQETVRLPGEPAARLLPPGLRSGALPLVLEADGPGGASP